MTCNFARYSVDLFKRNEMGGSCSTYGRRSGAYRVLVEGQEKRRPLRRGKRRFEGNIKVELKERSDTGRRLD